MDARLPKDVWTLIRSFSGDTAYGQTPTALLIHALRFFDDSKGLYMFDFGLDGYSSTIINIRKGGGYFRKPMSKCQDEFCSTCNIRDWSCGHAQPNKWRPRQILRILHQGTDGHFIRALK